MPIPSLDASNPGHFLDPRNSDALLARAGTFLDGVEISHVILETINARVCHVIDTLGDTTYDQAYDKVGEDASEGEIDEAQAEIADALACEINEHALEYRVAFLFQDSCTEQELEYSFMEVTREISDRAADFLKDVEITDEFLKILNEDVYKMAYDIDAYEQARKEGKNDDQTYQAGLARDIANKVNAGDVQGRIGFLLERGKREDQLKAEISEKTAHVPEPS